MNTNNDDPITWESNYKLQETDFLGKSPAKPVQEITIAKITVMNLAEYCIKECKCGYP